MKSRSEFKEYGNQQYVLDHSIAKNLEISVRQSGTVSRAHVKEKNYMEGCQSSNALVYSGDFSHNLQCLGYLFRMYESESTFWASPTSNSHLLALVDYARLCHDFTEDTLRVRHSSLRPAILLEIHWYASTAYQFSSYIKRVFVWIQMINLDNSFCPRHTSGQTFFCLFVHYYKL